MPLPAAWTFVRRFAADAAGAHELSALIQHAARGLAEVIGARAIGIALYDGLFDQAWIAIDHPAAGIEIMRLSLDAPAPATDETQHSAAILALFEHHGLEPLLVNPLVADGQPLGLMAVDMSGRARLDEHTTDLVLLIGDQLAAAISRAHQRERAARAERRARELELLDQVRRAVSTRRHLADLFHHVVEQTAATFGYRRVSLYVLRGETLLLQHQVGYADLPPIISWDDDLLGQVVRSGQPLLRPAPCGDAAAGPGSTSAACVPLRVGGLVCGVLSVESVDEQAPTERDLHLLTALAEQIEMAIEFDQLYDALEARVSQMALVEEISRAVTASLDQDAALRAIVTQVPRAVPCQRLSLTSYDAEAGHVLVRAHWTADEVAAIESGTPIRLEEDGGGVALRIGRLHYVYDLAESPSISSWPLRAEGLGSVVHVPIMSPEGCMGILSLGRTAPRAFNEHDLALLASLAPHIATAFKNADLYARAQRAYAELAAQQQRNVQVEKLRALGELASGVAHDFNNLLAIILGHTELLKSPTSPHFTRSRRAIMQAAQDGARTVRRIQEFVRAQPEQHSTPVDLAELADDVLQLTRPRWRDGMQGRGTTIVVRQELRGVPRILGDAAELREVVTNLILNAVDAMPQGGTLTLATGAGDGGVWLEVRDTGVGIAPETRERIFEPFYTTKAQRGTGLGLAVSRSIALRHGGDLGVESTLGAGACFRLTLPAPATIPETAEPAEPHPAAPVTPLRVLLIDDDRGVRDTMVRLLALDGHHVACARDGAEALRIFSPGAYDIVCSDLGMPGMSGWEVIARLRERDPQPVMTLLTGWGAQIDQSEAQARGVDFIVPKPVDMITLRAALAAADKRRVAVRA